MRQVLITCLLLTGCGSNILRPVPKGNKTDTTTREEKKDKDDECSGCNSIDLEPVEDEADCIYGSLVGVMLSSGICFNDEYVTSDQGYGEINQAFTEIDRATVDYTTVRFGELFCEEFALCKTPEEYKQLYDLYLVFITFYQYNRDKWNYNTQFDYSLLHSKDIPHGYTWVILSNTSTFKIDAIVMAMLDLYSWIWDIPEEEQEGWYMQEFGTELCPKYEAAPDCPAVEYHFFKKIAKEVGLWYE